MTNNINTIAIFGIGAAGSNTFINLLNSYPNINFIVIDFDKVEDRNISAGTQPYTKTDINRPKTQSMQRIALMSKNKKITAVNKRVNSVEDIKNIIEDAKSTLIVDAFDNANSRNLFKKLSKDYNVVHIGFSASLTGEAVWNDIFEEMTESKADNEIDVCEMAIARPFIMSLTGIASISISNFLENGVKQNIYFDKSLNIKKF